MFWTMLGTITGAVLGLLVGVALAGTLGGVLGAVLGSLIGFVWRASRTTAARQPRGATVVEKLRLFCLPRGEGAECSLVRDERTGEWLDVEECSLCEPPHEVNCHKRCLMMVRDTTPRARRGAPAPEPAQR